MAGVAASSRQRSKIAPYLMIAPALIYLAIFFVWPVISLAMTSLSTAGGSVFLPTMEFGWKFSNYSEAFSKYQDQILRSFGYAIVATLVCLLLAYPLAYVIAFKAGRYKNLILGLVILPFFVTFLIRTIAWKTILADDGWVVSALGSVGLLPSDGRLLSTSWAVIGGLIYNWIIFMILPLYVSLEKIDPRLIGRQRICTRRTPAASPKWFCRCRCRASSQAACWCSSPPRATSSTRRISEARRRP